MAEDEIEPSASRAQGARELSRSQPRPAPTGIQNFLTLFSENKLLAALWTIFTAAFLYAVQHWYTSDEQFAAIRALTTTVEEQRTEFDLANKEVEIHDAVVKELNHSAEAAVLDDKALLPQNLQATGERIVAQFSSDRRQLSSGRAILSNQYFDLDALKELQTLLLKDLDEADSHLQKSIEFMRTMVTDFEKARQEAPAMRENADGLLYAQEAAARRVTVDHLLEKARRAHNDKVVDANAQLHMYRLRSKLFIAAVVYMGAFVGGLGGWFSGRRRRAKESVDAQEDTVVAADETDKSD